MNKNKTPNGTTVPCIDLLADHPAYCTGMKVVFLKSGSLCEFVEYQHGRMCTIRRCDTGKTMTATLTGITPANAPLHLQGGATAEPCNGESGCSQIR